MEDTKIQTKKNKVENTKHLIIRCEKKECVNDRKKSHNNKKNKENCKIIISLKKKKLFYF